VEPEELLEAYRARVADIAQRADAVRARIANVRGTATSGDGAVTVSVNVHGALEALSFAEAAESLSLPDLAAEILRTSRKARLRAASAGADALVPLIGADSALADEARADDRNDTPPDLG
jgi:DNA-binding protein YbaB